MEIPTTNQYMGVVTIRAPESETVTFQSGGAQVLILDKDGFTYMGNRIEDAGEAHKAWMEVMALMARPKYFLPAQTEDETPLTADLSEVSIHEPSAKP